MLTTNASASMESRPCPLEAKMGRSSPISSGVVCSIRFLTSISLMRVRKSESDIRSCDFVVNYGPGQTCTGASLLANPLRSTHALGEDPLCRREQLAATPARPCLWAYLLDLGPAALRCLLAGSRFADPSIAPVSHRIWPFPSLTWRPYAARH